MAWKEYSGDEHGYRDLIKKHHPDAKVGRGNADGITQHTVGHQDHVVGHYDSHHKTGKVKVYEEELEADFGVFIKEDAHQTAAAHHAAAATHKAEADSHEEGSLAQHKALAHHHKSLMMAHRAEAASKRLIKDRTASVQKADGHFKQAMHHYTIASGVGTVKEGSILMKSFTAILSEARQAKSGEIASHAEGMKKHGEAMLQHKHDAHVHQNAAQDTGDSESTRKAEGARNASNASESQFKYHASELKKIKEPAAVKAHAAAHAHLASKAKEHAASLTDQHKKQGGTTTTLTDGARWMRERASSHAKSASSKSLKEEAVLDEANNEHRAKLKAYEAAAAKAEEVTKEAKEATTSGDHSKAAAQHSRAGGFHKEAADKAAGVDHSKRLYHIRKAGEHKVSMDHHDSELKKAK
jgi:hypothetical protein